MVNKAILMLLSIWLSACQSVGTYVANVKNDESVFTTHNDIAYGDEVWQKLDIYVPTEAKSSFPVVMFFYGGGWSYGEKKEYAFVANSLAKHGFITVIPDYVKYPQAKFPAFEEDAATASKWVYENIEKYQGQKNNLHLLGHSAGAHIAAILIADKHYLKQVGLTSQIFNSFVGLAGPYNFTPAEEKYQKIFGSPAEYPKMQVSNFIDGDEPPMLLLHGADDNLVGKFNLDKLEKSIKDKGGKVETVILPDIGHYLIIGQFSPTVGDDNQTFQKTMEFFKKHSSIYNEN
jgi:acetyl esterase/lipase